MTLSFSKKPAINVLGNYILSHLSRDHSKCLRKKHCRLSAKYKADCEEYTTFRHCKHVFQKFLE